MVMRKNSEKDSIPISVVSCVVRDGTLYRIGDGCYEPEKKDFWLF